MTRELTQRELRNQSGAVMRALDRGESFLVTRDGVAVGELIPVRRRRFVPTGVALRALAAAPALVADRFRAELDVILDQDPTPRG
jgi:antitoxin (DNA-binding transcriptional repressor) of toxin-antitoxin stability system